MVVSTTDRLWLTFFVLTHTHSFSFQQGTNTVSDVDLLVSLDYSASTIPCSVVESILEYDQFLYLKTH